MKFRCFKSLFIRDEKRFKRCFGVIIFTKLNVYTKCLFYKTETNKILTLLHLILFKSSIFLQYYKSSIIHYDGSHSLIPFHENPFEPCIIYAGLNFKRLSLLSLLCKSHRYEESLNAISMQSQVIMSECLTLCRFEVSAGDQTGAKAADPAVNFGKSCKSKVLLHSFPDINDDIFN